MAGEPIITVVGNATADADIKYLPSGIALSTFTVASTPRVKRGDTWEDGEATFYRCSVWRDPAAEMALETIKKGMRLIVAGRLKTRSYTSNDGEKRIAIEIDVDEVGPTLRYASAKVTKAKRNGAESADSSSAAGSDDPWGSTSEPPF